MKYEIPTEFGYEKLLAGDMRGWSCIHTCDSCIFYDAKGDKWNSDWTCFRLTASVSPTIIDRLVEYGVITKIEAMDLLLRGGDELRDT